MAHFAHYLRRDVVQIDYGDQTHPWFAENQPDDQGFNRPSYHVTRATSGAAERVVAGDTIWMFAQLYSPWGKLPAALDARIEVASIDQRDGDAKGFRYAAGPRSVWFPIATAARCISTLKTRDAKGNIKSLLSAPEQPIGQALQRLRELQNPLVLEKHIEKLQAMELHFVSYRLIDGTKPAFKKVADLVGKRRSVFWDRWSLPRRIAERREFLKDKALDRYISAQLSTASVVWGIETPMYGVRGSYSAKEKELASNLGLLKMHKFDN